MHMLLNTDSLATIPSHTLSVEMIAPERMTIAVRAYLLVLADLEKGETRPPFPSDPDMTFTGLPTKVVANRLPYSVLSRPGVGEAVERFNDIIGKVFVVLEQNFGHFLILEDKSGSSRGGFTASTFVGVVASATGNEVGQQVTHQYETFPVSYSREKQPFFELMKTTIDAIPRLMPSGITLSRLVEVLCRYTVHIDPEVIRSASEALIRIAKQGDARLVVTEYAGLIRSINDRYSSALVVMTKGPLSDGSVHSASQGPLKLYVNLFVELLQILLDRYDTELMENPGGVSIDDTRKTIDDAEAIGLLFLCNHAPVLRRLAVQILRLVSAVDSKLCGDSDDLAPNCMAFDSPKTQTSNVPESKSTRVIHLLEQEGHDILKLNNSDSFSLLGYNFGTADRVRLQQLQRHRNRDILIYVSQSDNRSDQFIWNLCFPEFIRRCMLRYPAVTAQCRMIVHGRLQYLHGAIQAAAESSSSRSNPNNTLGMPRIGSKLASASDSLIEQWRIYLVFVCTTAQPNPVISPNGHLGANRRRILSSNNGGPPLTNSRMDSVMDLFHLMLSLLSSEHAGIREAVVSGLSYVNPVLYRVLLEALQPLVKSMVEDAKPKISQRPYQTLRRSRKFDRLRVEVTRVYERTARCLLLEESHLWDDFIMNVIMNFVKEMKSFLSDEDVDRDLEFNQLKMHFCGFVERVYEAISRVEQRRSVMSFETRLALFKMFEAWCGYGERYAAVKMREEKVIEAALGQCHDDRERNEMRLYVEEERKALNASALSAMATLCNGPLVEKRGRDKSKKFFISFDVLSLFQWIDSVFNSTDPRLHSIAKRALETMLRNNKGLPILLEDIVDECFAGDPISKSTQGFFSALVEIITKDDYPCVIHRMLSLALFKAGDQHLEMRQQAIRLLRAVEERAFKISCAGEYEFGLTNNLPIIYKQAQMVLSARLARDHPELTHLILSEIVMRFETVNGNFHRQILGYILPWLRNTVLWPSGTETAVSNVNSDNNLSPTSRALLNNLLYLTIKFGDMYVKEVESVWKHLVEAEHTENARAITNYLLDLGLEKRNAAVIVHAKRILVYLGRTAACSIVIDDMIEHISPKSMVPSPKSASTKDYLSNDKQSKVEDDDGTIRDENSKILPEEQPFIADLDQILPSQPVKRPIFSRGQLAMLYLVDFAVEIGAELAPHLPLLLHVILVQLDHFTSIVCDQARCLLFNLVQSIIIRQSPCGSEVYRQAEELLTILREKERSRFWAYEDITPNAPQLPPSITEMQTLVKQVAAVFMSSDNDLRQKWAETSLKWATVCPFRHIACRSFQVFRSLMPVLNQRMVADMLARLASTIAHPSDDVQGFALEILITLRAVVESLDRTTITQYPQLFWAVVACLHSPHEQEHLESLLILERLIERLDLCNEATRTWLFARHPHPLAPPPAGSADNAPTSMDGTSRLSGGAGDIPTISFYGLQPLILKGLRSASAEPIAMRLLCALLPVTDSAIMDVSGGRLCFLLLGTFPRLLHDMDQPQQATERNTPHLADDLASVVEHESKLGKIHLENSDIPGDNNKEQFQAIARILRSYSRRRFRSKDDFLRQYLNAICDAFFPEFERRAVTFLFGLLHNKLPFYRRKTLQILRPLLSFVDLPALIGNGSRSHDKNEAALEMLGGLLRLLQSDFSDDAVAVLDEIVNTDSKQFRHKPQKLNERSRPSVSELSRDGSSTATLEDEVTPDIPTHFRSASRMTRAYLHSVVYSSSHKSGMPLVGDHQNIQFSVEDFSTEPDGWTSRNFGDVQSAGWQDNVGQLVLELHDLDHFFNEDAGVDQPALGADNIEGTEMESASEGLDDNNMNIQRSVSASSFDFLQNHQLEENGQPLLGTSSLDWSLTSSVAEGSGHIPEENSEYGLMDSDNYEEAYGEDESAGEQGWEEEDEETDSMDSESEDEYKSSFPLEALVLGRSVSAHPQSSSASQKQTSEPPISSSERPSSGKMEDKEI
ncbi:uncharacterized protein VTP21DRAFT_10310 [Calcarisporiella thermophila]|uniref:uncharacterized protein n=1 Tax=Calcarisporiella thermophila TaxID=911321 RepID=UPI003743D42B